MKIAINTCFGGFGLSDEAFELLLNKKGIEFERVFDEKWEDYNYYKKGKKDDDGSYLSQYDFIKDDMRADPDLIAVFEELGVDKAGGRFADIKIIDVPDDLEWHISEYDGIEHVAENHETWS